MTPAIFFHIITGMTITLLLAVFAFSSFKEQKPRAALLGIILCFIFGEYSVLPFWFEINQNIYWFSNLLIWSFAILYFLPLNKPAAVVLNSPDKRVDERDTVFAREEYTPGTDKYNQYYAKYPQLKSNDDRFKKLPELLSPGGYYYDEQKAVGVKNVFKAIGALTTKVDGTVSASKTEIDPVKITDKLKQQIINAGASDVGIAILNPMYIYSHIGRGPEPWGDAIDLKHKFAIIFTLEMDYDKVEQAPDCPITEESARQYKIGAEISVAVANQIREMGYPARAHISDSNYQIMLPPVAVDAGLGELSRMGYLISPILGPRIRLGAITTDLPLVVDKPISFGLQEFCKVCLKCADNCPSAAIPRGDKTEVRGVQKWGIDTIQCLRFWRIIGTDCGLCMRVCPYSHPPTFVHNIVRSGIRHSAIARRLSIWGDDFFYGRKINFLDD